jgi:oligopeptide transport system substrate-binding protein
LHRNFFLFDDRRGLVPDLAEGCTRSKKKTVLTCRLKKDLKWSDGSPLTSADFLAAYQRLLAPATKAPRADMLFPVKGAEKHFEGRASAKELGIQTPDPRTVVFEFVGIAPDFEYNLAAFQLSPAKAVPDDPTKFVVTGPYKIRSWERGRQLILTANSHYPRGNPSRPDVEFSFIEDDSTALKLYEKNLLDFLRRLPTQYLAQYKKHPEYHWLAVTRLDYIGFGPGLKDKPSARKALSLALDYSQLQKLFHSDGKLGCVGVPEEWLPAGSHLCHEFNPAEARKTLGQTKLPTLTMRISSLAGEDIRRGAEWMQDQWRRNLKVNISLKMLENKLYLAELRQGTRPDLFRKGLAPDRPTCLAVLEVFSAGHPENLLDVNDAAFEKVLADLRKAESASQRRRLCQSGLKFLMDGFLLIPQGRMNFAILAKPTYTGWRLNQMNQLDLAELRRK